jgi:hypothetical protein
MFTSELVEPSRRIEMYCEILPQPGAYQRQRIPFGDHMQKVCSDSTCQGAYVLSSAQKSQRCLKWVLTET